MNGETTTTLPRPQVSVWQRRWGRLRRIYRNNFVPFIMSLPCVLHLFIFAYLPMFGIIIAFKDYRFDKGILGSKWVGFYNFKYLFSSATAPRITRNTIVMNLIFMSTGILASLTVALLMNEVQGTLRARFYQSAMFLPYFISYVIVGIFVFAFLSVENGIINHWLAKLGKDPIAWYNEPKYWPGILTLVNLWKGTGYGSILYLAVMLGIDPEYYEAAKIDGASKWQQIWYITLPMLVPIIIIQVLLSLGGMFRANFALFFNVPQDRSALYPTTDVIDTFVYRALIRLNDIGMASAASVYQSVVGFVLVVLANWAVRKIDPDRSLF
ncbi:MAG: sugar ABC transporter permease [Anaerolineae bacterium]|nr:sugar ABC transporter permease [Anaerolineae bacterium]